MTEAQIKYMVDRFLGWRLPSDFSPDNGISFTLHRLHHHEPSGTNLLDASQAEKMVRYMIDGMPISSAAAPAGASEEGLRSLIDEEHRKLTAGMNLIDAAHGEFIIKAAVNALRRLSPSADLLKAAKVLAKASAAYLDYISRGTCQKYVTIVDPGGYYPPLQRDMNLAIANVENLEKAHAEGSAEYLIWSNEHHAWWRANSQGYTADVMAAGRYSREEAITICKNARNGYRKNEIPTEIPISVDDLGAMDSRLAAIRSAEGEEV